MVIDPKLLETALNEAHLPALLMATVHLTGDASILTPELKPMYDFFSDSRTGGLSDANQEKIKNFARKAILDHFEGGRALPPAPSAETVRKMMDFVAGAEIPEHYAPFLMEELQMSGVDPKRPDWSSPKLRAAAAKLPVV